MERKLILCLASVLTGCCLGCSTRDTYPYAAQAPKVHLRVVKVDSQETKGQDGYGRNAVDGNPNTYWHTQWQGNSPGLPHEIVIELLPAATIRGFSYLPRQDASDHGTIKDYEFYVSRDGRNFGRPIKKGVFGPGKEEKIETFEPIKCRFIKLKAISEINGLPWTSVAEIGVIQIGEDISAKDYWRGQCNDLAGERHHSDVANPIGVFVTALAATGGLWLNGVDAYLPTTAEGPQEAAVETVRSAQFEAGLLTSCQILEVREVHIGEIPGSYTAVLADTNLGQMIVLMQYIQGRGSSPGRWWRRIYDAGPNIKRLY